jgi:hypothetical protein
MSGRALPVYVYKPPTTIKEAQENVNDLTSAISRAETLFKFKFSGKDKPVEKDLTDLQTKKDALNVFLEKCNIDLQTFQKEKSENIRKKEQDLLDAAKDRDARALEAQIATKRSETLQEHEQRVKQLADKRHHEDTHRPLGNQEQTADDNNQDEVKRKRQTEDTDLVIQNEQNMLKIRKHSIQQRENNETFMNTFNRQNKEIFHLRVNDKWKEANDNRDLRLVLMFDIKKMDMNNTTANKTEMKKSNSGDEKLPGMISNACTNANFAFFENKCAYDNLPKILDGVRSLRNESLRYGRANFIREWHKSRNFVLTTHQREEADSKKVSLYKDHVIDAIVSILNMIVASPTSCLYKFQKFLKDDVLRNLDEMPMKNQDFHVTKNFSVHAFLLRILLVQVYWNYAPVTDEQEDDLIQYNFIVFQINELRVMLRALLEAVDDKTKLDYAKHTLSSSKENEKDQYVKLKIFQKEYEAVAKSLPHAMELVSKIYPTTIQSTHEKKKKTSTPVLTLPLVVWDPFNMFNCVEESQQLYQWILDRRADETIFPTAGLQPLAEPMTEKEYADIINDSGEDAEIIDKDVMMGDIDPGTESESETEREAGNAYRREELHFADKDGGASDNEESDTPKRLSYGLYPGCKPSREGLRSIVSPYRMDKGMTFV